MRFAISTASRIPPWLAAIKKRLSEINTDIIADASYIATFLAPRRYTLFKEIGTTEKPDIFTAKIAEGRIGILVDGSPIALTVPYLFTEDFQTAEDYFVSPFAATVIRILRFFAVADRFAFARFLRIFAAF